MADELGARAAGGSAAARTAAAEVTVTEGYVEPRVADEFPGLCVRWETVPGRRRRSPRELVRRLDELSDRYRGGSVVAARTKPIPHAYRAFFRQIGLDPDVQRIPSEQAAVARLLQGGFRSVDVIADACLVALIETGVPVWALGTVDQGLGIRTTTTADCERAAARGQWMAPGSLAIAGDEGIHCLLFAAPAPARRPERVTLFTVGVDGVPSIHLDEALSICVDLLT
jgi:DNA/RNA-binding domain of Phe-tRNA-synthetase-like protein